MAQGSAAVTVYGLKACDTCRKTLKALPGAAFVDVRADGLPDSVLDRALEVFGQALVNTRSTTWRGLDAEEREKAPRDLIMTHPTLMKRPLIEAEGALYLGWTRETQAALLG